MLQPVGMKRTPAPACAAPPRQLHAPNVAIVVDAEREFDGFPGVKAFFYVWQLCPRKGALRDAGGAVAQDNEFAFADGTFVWRFGLARGKSVYAAYRAFPCAIFPRRRRTFPPPD